MTKLGDWIRDQLKETDRTRDDLAKAMGISPATLDGIIGGEIARPPDARLSALATFFGVDSETVRQLISGADLEEGADVRQGGPPGESTTSASYRARNEPPLRAGILDAAIAIPSGEVGKRQTVLLVPDGRTTLKGGTSILVDAQGTAAVIAAFDRHGVDLPFDHNHSTVLRAPKGESSPSFGWGKKISYEPGRGIVCSVEWTDEGHEDIRVGRYKYLSPVIGYDGRTGRVRAVHSAALTTMPATPHMPALAASYDPFKKGDDSMNGLIMKALQEDGTVATAEQKIGELKSLLETMGAELGDGADFVSIINAAIAKLKGDGGENKDAVPATEEAAVAASVRVKLGLPVNADKGVVLKALSALDGHVGYVPASDHAQMVSRVEALEDQESERNAEDLVQGCLSQGKLLATDEKQMVWARNCAKSTPDDFKQLMAHAPVIVPQGRTSPPTTTASVGNEDALIEKSLADHKGNHKEAMIALQTRLIGQHTDRGMSKQAAVAACEQTYPAIFVAG